jgi:hypothetical protein
MTHITSTLCAVALSFGVSLFDSIFLIPDLAKGIEHVWARHVWVVTVPILEGWVWTLFLLWIFKPFDGWEGNDGCFR